MEDDKIINIKLFTTALQNGDLERVKILYNLFNQSNGCIYGREEYDTLDYQL